MSNNDDNRPDSIVQRTPETDPNSPGDTSAGGHRREPVFNGFDMEEEDSFEEPDRDTDYTSSYLEDNLEDEEFDDALLEEEEEEYSDLHNQSFTDDRQPTRSWDELELDMEVDEQSEPPWVEEKSADAPPVSDNDADIYVAASSSLEAHEHRDGHEYSLDNEDDPDEWDEEDEYLEEGDDDDHMKWPLGLIIVTIIALLLLFAGGYGVIQQRAETQEEIRKLQAALATAANPTDVTASRDAVLAAEKLNAELRATVDTLTLENRRLTDTVAGLESQLETQQTATAALEPAITASPKAESLPATPTSAPPPTVTTKPVASQAAPSGPTTPQAAAPQPAEPQPAAPQPATPKSTAAASSGSGWFVNFGSYGQRAAAESRAARIKPATGKVVVTTGSKNGKTFYRVRVIELDNRQSAEKVARQLESEFGLSKLWVGQQ